MTMQNDGQERNLAQSEQFALPPPPPPFTLDPLSRQLLDVVTADRVLAQVRASFYPSTATLDCTVDPSLSLPTSPLAMTDVSLQARRAARQSTAVALSSSEMLLPRRTTNVPPAQRWSPPPPTQQMIDPALAAGPQQASQLALPDLTPLSRAWYDPHYWSPSLRASFGAGPLDSTGTAASLSSPSSSALQMSTLLSDGQSSLKTAEMTSSGEAPASVAALTISPADIFAPTSNNAMRDDAMHLNGDDKYDPAADSNAFAHVTAGDDDASAARRQRYSRHDMDTFGMDEPTVIIRMKRCKSCGGVEMPVSDRGGSGVVQQRRKTMCYACGLRFARVAQQTSAVALHGQQPRQQRQRRQSSSDAVDAVEWVSKNIQKLSQEGEPLRRMHLHMSGDGGEGQRPDQEEEDDSNVGVTTGATPRRRYPCPNRMCEKTFSTGGHATRHSRTHKTASLQLIACPYKGCEVTFTRRDNCTQHQRLRHDLKVRDSEEE